MIEVTSELFGQRFPALAGELNAQEMAELLAALEVHQILPSEALITEGTPVDDLFLVWGGQLDVAIQTRGGDRSVGQVGVGSFLGEVALLDPGPATATITAEQGCTALRLSRAAFLGLCDSHPALAAALLREIGRTLAARLRQGVALLDSSLGHGQTSPPEPQRLLAVHGALHGDVRS